MAVSPEDSYPVLEHLMGKMISGARAAPVQVGFGYPKPNWDQRQIISDPWNAQYLRQASRWHHCCSNHESNLCIYAPLSGGDELLQRTTGCSQCHPNSAR